MHIIIWGLGKVGRSAIQYFSRQNCTITVLNNKPLSTDDSAFLQAHNTLFELQTDLTIATLFEQCDHIIASPGIDVRPYKQFHHKLITELDIFARHIHNKTVAITGSLGKTTVTTLLDSLLSHSGLKTIAAGNIGIPLLNTIDTEYDLHALELSSFQLEHIQQFAPDVAVWTNFHPNHLDRHDSLDDYFEAKCNIFKFQQSDQLSLLPTNIIPLLEDRKLYKPTMNFFSHKKPLTTLLKKYTQHTFYWLSERGIIKYTNEVEQCIVPRNDIPHSSFELNWIILAATLDLLQYNPRMITDCPPQILEHRLEYVTTINNVMYYNDSKSTISESTYAAVTNFANQPVILLLGGLSKGVDRQPLIEQLRSKVKRIICFGAEAEHLANLCTQHNITSTISKNLNQAYAQAQHYAKPGDIVLFSPGGSSFDLFDNYIHRGKAFKDLCSL